MTIGEAYRQLRQQLRTIYDTGEAQAVSDRVLESLTGYSRSMLRIHTGTTLTQQQQDILKKVGKELLQHRPMQYVLGKSYFYGLELFVDENVLIPRPETEELVDWIIKTCKTLSSTVPVILDVGTGSGCIPLALKSKLKDADMHAIDISEAALNVAQRNAQGLNLDVHFIKADILEESSYAVLPSVDILISNPPYILPEEAAAMKKNVLKYEPGVALFVTDNDPLQFYKAIEKAAQAILKKDGQVFLELNQKFATATEQYFRKKGWQTELRPDINRNLRMLRCFR